MNNEKYLKIIFFVKFLYTINFIMSKISFYVNKDQEVITSSIMNNETAQFTVKAPVYADSNTLINIGVLTIIKNIYNLDSSGNVQDGTNALWQYYVDWAPVTNIKGVAVFRQSIEGNNLLYSPDENNATEIPGIYFGGCLGAESTGDFSNYGGLMLKIKDTSPIVHFILDYSVFNPLNNLL